MIRVKLYEAMGKKGIFKISQLFELTKKIVPKGVDRRTLTKLRNGELKRIDISVLDVLCEALNCELHEIVDYVPNKKK